MGASVTIDMFQLGDRIRNIHTKAESRIVLVELVDGKTVYQTDEIEYGKFVRFSSDYAEHYEKVREDMDQNR